MRYAMPPKFILIYILYFSVIMDIVYGVLDYLGFGSLRLSLLYRLSILVLFFAIVLRRNDDEAWLVKFFFVFGIGLLAVWGILFGRVDLVLETSFLLKAFYPICIAVIMYTVISDAFKQGLDVEQFIQQAIFNFGFIASLAFMFSFITGIGQSTYGDWGFGIKSFFTGGNDIGLAMLVSIIVGWGVFWQRLQIIDLIKILLITFSIVLIGSRAAWVGIIAITAFFTIAFVFARHVDSTKVYAIKIGISLILFSLLFGISFYVADNFELIAFNVSKITELMDGISPRLQLEHAGSLVFEKREPVYDWLGQGTQYFYAVWEQYYLTNGGKYNGSGSVFYKQVEQDVYDLIGSYGYILGGYFIIYHLYQLTIAARHFWFNRNVMYLGFLWAVLLFVVHGFTAGHALSSPLVCTLIGTIYGYIKFKNCQNTIQTNVLHPSDNVQVVTS